MIIEMTIHDSKNARRGRVQVDLVFDPKDRTRGEWRFQENLEGNCWSNVVFSMPADKSKGRFEVKDWGVLWLWDRDAAGTERNFLILHDAPMKEGDYKHDNNFDLGKGRLFDPSNRDFQDGTVRWKAPRLTPLRRKILDILARVIPAHPGFLPIPNMIDGSKEYTGGVTNCGTLPGWIARQLGYVLPGQIAPRKNKLGDEIKPIKIGADRFLKVNPKDKDKLALTSSMTVGWGDDHWMERAHVYSSYPKAVERALGKAPGTIRIDYYKNAELKKNDVRPRPGDIYTTVGWIDIPGRPKTWGLPHVGIIIDSVGERWMTADCGQFRKNAAAYKMHKFKLEDGTFMLDPPESNTPDGNDRWLDGWVDVDELFYDWEG